MKLPSGNVLSIMRCSGERVGVALSIVRRAGRRADSRVQQRERRPADTDS
jgi:hypothetical protein